LHPPEELCKLMKCRKPAGSWCQVVEESGIRVPKCLCPKACPRLEAAPVCSVVGKSYLNQCLLHKEACRKRRKIGVAHNGQCVEVKAACSEEEYNQFPFRLLDWFVQLSEISRNGKISQATKQVCMSQAERLQLAEWQFHTFDRNKNGKLGQRELKKFRYKHMPLEHCARKFLQSCDIDGNRKIILKEWLSCLVLRSETWYE
uniref:SPARC-like 2 n=1 Tax=Latimeria chalumnae TaxID=7897 RepID=H3AFJ9_LATCH